MLSVEKIREHKTEEKERIEIRDRLALKKVHEETYLEVYGELH